MIWVIASLAYVVGWFVFTVLMSRFVATSEYFKGECHDEWDTGSGYSHHSSYRSACVKDHRPGCWRSDGFITPGLVSSVGASAIAWPILCFPVAAFWLAKRKPTPPEAERQRERERIETAKKLEEQRVHIEKLERVAGIQHG